MSRDILNYFLFISAPNSEFGRCGNPKRLCSGSDLSPPLCMDDTRLCQSQPDPHFGGGNALPSDKPKTDLDMERPGFSFSQPAQIEDLLLSSQLNPTQHTQSSSGSQVCSLFHVLA